MKLISMTYYVLELTSKERIEPKYLEFVPEHITSYVSDLSKIERYAKFLKQPLTLGMFVPCDEYGNVLEEPLYDPTNEQYWAGAFYQYQQAKERVLFKGFEVDHKSDVSICVYNGSFDIRFKIDGTIDSFRFRTVEHLTRRDVTLTKSAIKNFGI